MENFVFDNDTLSLQGEFKGPIIHITGSMFHSMRDVTSRKEIHLYGFRSGDKKMVVWFREQIENDLPICDSSSEYMEYLNENGLMYAEFDFYEEPQFGNWGIIAFILDRLGRNYHETIFINRDISLYEAAQKLYALWFGPSNMLIEKLYPL